MQDRIDVQRGDFFLKINKRADQNRTLQGEFFSQKHSQRKQSKKFPKHIRSIPKSLPKALPKHYQTTPKQGRIARKEVCLIRTGTIPINVQDGINMQGGFFLKKNRRADPNKTVQGGILSQN